MGTRAIPIRVPRRSCLARIETLLSGRVTLAPLGMGVNDRPNRCAQGGQGSLLLLVGGVKTSRFHPSPRVSPAASVLQGGSNVIGTRNAAVEKTTPRGAGGSMDPGEETLARTEALKRTLMEAMERLVRATLLGAAGTGPMRAQI